MSPAARAPVGWLLTVEPVGDAVAWSLLRDDGRPITGPVGAGVRRDARALRRVAAEVIPSRDARARPDGLSGLWAGPLTSPAAERGVASALSGLVPDVLREELLATPGRDPAYAEHTVTVAARGWLADVPWEVIALDDAASVRLVERARVAGGLSPALVAGAGDRPGGGRPTDPGLVLVDHGPVTDPLRWPSIYSGAYPEEWLAPDAVAQTDRRVSPFQQMSAEDLGRELRAEPCSRFTYFGHVFPGQAGAPASAALVLSERGRADLLTARRWLAGPERWPMPERVALLGCASDDSGAVEQSGLAVAAIKSGARVVTATRWLIPTRRGTDQRAAAQLAVAVYQAQRAPRVLDAIRAWQLARLAAWRRRGQPDDSPLLWAALITYVLPARSGAR